MKSKNYPIYTISRIPILSFLIQTLALATVIPSSLSPSPNTQQPFTSSSSRSPPPTEYKDHLILVSLLQDDGKNYKQRTITKMTSLHYTCLLFYWSLQRTSRQYLCLQMTLEHAWSLGTGFPVCQTIWVEKGKHTSFERWAVILGKIYIYG
jgi:hypothetical protein